MFQNYFLNSNPQHTQAWEDKAKNVDESETGFSIIRGEEWTFICHIDFVHYQFNSGRDNSGFIVPETRLYQAARNVCFHLAEPTDPKHRYLPKEMVRQLQRNGIDGDSPFFIAFGR